MELEQLEKQNSDAKTREAPVEIEEPTRKLLRNQPKLTLWPRLDLNIITEVEKGCAKRRWGEMSKDQTGENEVDVNPLDDKMASRRVSDSNEHTVDLRKRRVTKRPTNKRVIVPEQQGPELEDYLQHLKSRIEQASRLYMAKECDERGNIKQNMLDDEERKGMRQAISLTSERTAAVFLTDKAGRFSVDSYENYVECMQEHVKNDEVVSEKEKERIVKQLNGHSNGNYGSYGLVGDTLQ